MPVVRSAWKITIAAGLMLVAGYFALPGQGGKDIGYSVIGVASVACVLAGIAIRRPADRRAWLLLAAGNVCFVLADGVWDFYQFVLHQQVPMPSVADALYLAGYPFIFAGVVQLTRDGLRTRSRESYADATIICIGALAVAWHFLMGSYAHDPTLQTLGRLVSLAYPVMDIGILFIVLQGLLFGAARRPVHWLLATAMMAMLVADFAYDVMTRHGSYTTGNPIDAGWLINYVLLGAAALHPSMAAKFSADPGRVTDSGRRLPLVALSGFVAPAILLLTDLYGARADVSALASMTIVSFVLVFLRMRWMFGRIEQQTSSLRDALSVRESLEADLRHQAFHDSLTGLANRALLHDRIDHALQTLPRKGATIAVLICDLDSFKTVNDSLGHLAGDRMLLVAARRLQSVVRPGDTVARLGGDEFAILLENVEQPSIATAVAERIVSVLRQPADIDEREVGLSASVGVVVAGLGASTEQLLSDADSAMYEAKSAGKNCFRTFEESMHARIVERLELTTSFRTALQHGEFFLQYQPHFSLTDGTLEGFEALVRWQHPTLGLINPDRFIPLAEETGFIVPLGRWVLEAACDQAMRWPTGDGAPLTMSVNLSGRQLADDNLLSDVSTALAFSGLPARRLILEITESALMADTDQTVWVLTELQATGVRLAIDDFGTGYSSLSYLRQFPVEIIKIDKSFVDPLNDASAEGAAFVRSIIRLAHSLGLQTIAEGIEHPGQREQLITLGCDSAQGFLLGRPLDRQAAADLVRMRQIRHRALPLLDHAD